MKTTLAVIALALAFAGVAGSSATTEGVRAVSYAPKPVYDDLSVVKVHFTTSDFAGPGREYYAALNIGGNDTRDCAKLSNSALPFFGGSRRGVALGGALFRQTVRLRAPRSDYPNLTFCRGPAVLSVGTCRCGEGLITYFASQRVLKKIKLRVYRAP